METNLSRLKTIFASLLVTGGLLFAGCGDDNDMEDAMDETGDAIEDAADATKDAAEDAADEVRDATN